MLRRRVAASLLVLTLVVGGCAGSDDATRAPSPTPPAVALPASPRATQPADDGGERLYDPSADARAEIEAALAQARTDGKHVLIDYGADWCPDCHVLAAYLDSPEGRALVDRAFHVVSVDVGMWDNHLDVAKDYGDAISNGIPAVVALRGDGSIVGSSKDGALASASSMSKDDVLSYLEGLAP